MVSLVIQYSYHQCIDYDKAILTNVYIEILCEEYCSVSTVTSQPVTHYGLKLQRTASQTLKLPFLDSSAYSGT